MAFRRQLTTRTTFSSDWSKRERYKIQVESKGWRRSREIFLRQIEAERRVKKEFWGPWPLRGVQAGSDTSAT
jgi:hypothetical protein